MSHEPTHQPERAITGNCPACGRLCIVFNNHESWPLVECACAWHGPTTSLLNHARAERLMPWQMDEARSAFERTRS